MQKRKRGQEVASDGVEKLDLVAGSALIKHIIENQADRFEKALLELLMNSVDIGATEVNIQLCTKQVVVDDNGPGFKNRKEIEDYFLTVGAEYDDDRRDNKTYGQFGIGRCQAFNYGINTWWTNEFEMVVNYLESPPITFRTMDESLLGCTVAIDFFDPLTKVRMAEIVRDMHIWCKYMPIKITLNDEQLTTPVADIKWSTETADAYIKVTQHKTLAIYNQGVFVRTYSDSQFGVGGVVVTKSRLGLDTTRTNILHKCSLWKRRWPGRNP